MHNLSRNLICIRPPDWPPHYFMMRRNLLILCVQLDITILIGNCMSNTINGMNRNLASVLLVGTYVFVVPSSVPENVEGDKSSDCRNTESDADAKTDSFFRMGRGGWRWRGWRRCGGWYRVRYRIRWTTQYTARWRARWKIWRWAWCRTGRWKKDDRTYRYRIQSSDCCS